MHSMIWLGPDAQRYRVTLEPSELGLQEVRFDRLEDGQQISTIVAGGDSLLLFLREDLEAALRSAKERAGVTRN